MTLIIAGIDPSINATGVYKMFLDIETLEVVDVDYLAFTSVKKNSSDKIIHYKTKDFFNYLDKNIFMYEHIINFLRNTDYVYIEDYAYSATGKVFHIGEFVGGIKLHLFFEQIKMGSIEPTVVKKFATGNGNSDKISMIDEYDKTKSPDKVDFSFLPQYRTPKEDLVDAYYMAKFLQLELKLRKGLIELKDLSENVRNIFLRVTKSNPTNILAREWIEDRRKT